MIKGSKNSVYIGSKIPKNLRLMIEKAVNAGVYLNTSEFVRIAIKDKLREEGLLSSVVGGGS